MAPLVHPVPPALPALQVRPGHPDRLGFLALPGLRDLMGQLALRELPEWLDRQAQPVLRESWVRLALLA